MKHPSTSKLPSALAELVASRLEEHEQVIAELAGDIGTGICLTDRQLMIVRQGYRATGIPWGRRVFAFPRHGVETIEPHFSFAQPTGTPNEFDPVEIRFGVLVTGLAEGGFSSVFFYAGLTRCQDLSGFICRCLSALWDDGRKVWPGGALRQHKLSDLPGELGEALPQILRGTEHILAELMTRPGEAVVLTDQRLLTLRLGEQIHSEALSPVPWTELTEVLISSQAGPVEDGSVLGKWLGQGGLGSLSIEPLEGDTRRWEGDPPRILDLSTARLTQLAEFFTLANGELARRG